MHPIKNPSVCVLTQTAGELPAYYREFFKDFDLFFITFKQENRDAVAFLPQSTMHEGRNYMWELVKGKYDYYLFIDDDQVFYELRPFIPLPTEAILSQLQRKLPLTSIVPFMARIRRIRIAKHLYRRMNADRFKKLLIEKIEAYHPMVASIRTLHSNIVDDQDQYALRRNRQVRRLTWFDAQVTLFSNMGADLIMPYLPGWWSPQVPTYCLSNLAFKAKAIYILDMAASNENHFVYRDDFDGRKELREVADWLSQGLLDQSCGPLFNETENFINHEFASETAKEKVIVGGFRAETLQEVLISLGDSFDLHHPYIYDRHKKLVDALSVNGISKTAEKIHG